MMKIQPAKIKYEAESRPKQAVCDESSSLPASYGSGDATTLKNEMSRSERASRSIFFV